MVKRGIRVKKWFILLLLFPATQGYGQTKADAVDLLIRCYEILYASGSRPVNEEPAPTPPCMPAPAHFYDNFNTTVIGFNLLQTREVFAFAFRDSVCAPLKIPLQITSEYGEVRGTNIHQGVDFRVSVGDTIYSVFCGEVRISKYDEVGYGNVVVVRNYNMSELLYGHLDRSLVRVGQKVEVGDPIGLGGNTGTSSGPHLHLEIRSSGYSFNPIINGRFLQKHPIHPPSTSYRQPPKTLK